MQEQKINVSAKLVNKIGYIKLHVEDNDIINKKLNIILSIDRSGSMNRSLSNVKHCLNNIITYLYDLYKDESQKNNILDIKLTVIVFNHNVDIICKQVEVCNDDFDIEALTEQINNIKATGLTNIEKVFNSIQNVYAPGYKNIHAFMTDGEPTEGIFNQKKLLDILISKNQNIDTYFLGFGLEHNSRMLEYFTDNLSNSQYFYIDNIENAGMIYGEILYKSLYVKYTEIEISSSCESMRFYNSKNCEWQTSIHGNSMGNGDTYIYNFKLDSPDYNADKIPEEDLTINMLYKIRGVTDNNDSPIQPTSIVPHYYPVVDIYFTEFCLHPVVRVETDTFIDLLKHRMNVIDLMYRFKKQILDTTEDDQCEKQDAFNTPKIVAYCYEKNSIKFKFLYREFVDYFSMLQKKETEFDEYKKMFKQLLDDLYIHIKLFDNDDLVHMYCYTRFNTQINQLSYNITKIHNSAFDSKSGEKRYNISQDSTTAFSTPKHIELMRNVSQGYT